MQANSSEAYIGLKVEKSTVNRSSILYVKNICWLRDHNTRIHLLHLSSLLVGFFFWFSLFLIIFRTDIAKTWLQSRIIELDKRRRGYLLQGWILGLGMTVDSTRSWYFWFNGLFLSQRSVKSILRGCQQLCKLCFDYNQSENNTSMNLILSL